MSRKAAIRLIQRGFAANRSHEFGNFPHPFSFFRSNLHNLGHKGRLISPETRIDFSSINDVDDAICLFREMGRMRPQPCVVAYSKLLNVIVKMKHYSVALYVFDEMRQIGAPVNEFTLNIAINCCCLLKRVDYGFAIFGIFFKSGVKPNAATFTVLINGHFLDHKVTEALALFKKFLALIICEPDDTMILTVINGLCKAGHSVTACGLLPMLEEFSWKPSVKAYNAIIDGFCKGARVDDALLLLSETIAKGISPSVVTYTALIQGLCDVGRWKDVQNLLDEMVNRKVSSNVITLNVLVNAYCREGKVKEAEDFVAQQNICPNIVTYATLIHGYCKKGEVDEAWRLFLDVPRKGLEHNLVTYSTMIHGLFSNDRFSDGWKLFNYMEKKGVRPDIVTSNILINGLCRAGKLSIARDLFDQLPSKGLQPNVQTYKIIIGALYQGGYAKEAKYLVKEMKRNGCESNSVLQGNASGVGGNEQKGLLDWLDYYVHFPEVRK